MAKSKSHTPPAARLQHVKTGADRWWEIIERSRDGDPDEQEENLLALLTELTAEEILAFDKFVQEKIRDAFRYDLWGVAYIMNGGCSDDGFDYFCGWLVGRGRKHYEAALANPEDAAKGIDGDDEDFENEAMFYVASRAWAAKTGKPSDDYYAIAPKVGRSIKGKPFDEDTIYDKHPKLARKFGG